MFHTQHISFLCKQQTKQHFINVTQTITNYSLFHWKQVNRHFKHTTKSHFNRFKSASFGKLVHPYLSLHIEGTLISNRSNKMLRAVYATTATSAILSLLAECYCLPILPLWIRIYALINGQRNLTNIYVTG